MATCYFDVEEQAEAVDARLWEATRALVPYEVPQQQKHRTSLRYRRQNSPVSHSAPRRRNKRSGL